MSEILNAFVGLLLEVIARMKQRKESDDIYSRQYYLNCYVSPLFKIQAASGSNAVLRQILFDA